MRRLALLLLLLPATVYAQNWSGIIASSRAIRWDTNAGLPATFPDGETTPNPWTPPTRTTISATINPEGSFGTPVAPTDVNNALASCPAGQVVFLSAGNYYFNADIGPLSSNCTLRQAQGAKVFLFGTARYFTSISTTASNVSWTGTYAQGSTTITLASVAGAAVGRLMVLQQCNDGLSGIPNCGTGTQTDSGAAWVCGGVTCAEQGASLNAQFQVVLITGVNGGANTVTFTPGIYMPNWSSTNTPWVNIYSGPTGCGLEGGTVDGTNRSSGDTMDFNGYACWVTGVRTVNGANNIIVLGNSKNWLIANDYFTSQPPNAPEPLKLGPESDTIFLNGLYETGPGPYFQVGSVGDVVAYNFAHFGWSNSGNQGNMGNVEVNHSPGISYILFEGNEVASIQSDNDHGTQNLDTYFRNLTSANDPPYTKNTGIVALAAIGPARFMNMIGNVAGSSTTTTYKSTASANTSNPVIIVGAMTATGTFNDTLATNSSFLWGNYDVITGANRWCGNSSDTGWGTTCGSTSEVPTSLAGNAAPFSNPVPTKGDTGAGQAALPPSFFLPTTVHANGGTGLSWWKVCTNYPTCSTFQTQPFPPIGPDVTGGSVIGGFNYGGRAYDVPAAIAWKNAPIDTTYQNSYSISSSSWSAGVETLTFAGGVLPTTPVGSFQVSGGPCDTGTNEAYLTSSSATTMVYALASNPGSCAGGTVKWPNIRQWSSTLFQADPVGSTNPAPAVMFAQAGI